MMRTDARSGIGGSSWMWSAGEQSRVGCPGSWEVASVEPDSEGRMSTSSIPVDILQHTREEELVLVDAGPLPMHGDLGVRLQAVVAGPGVETIARGVAVGGRRRIGDAGVAIDTAPGIGIGIPGDHLDTMVLRVLGKNPLRMLCSLFTVLHLSGLTHCAPFVWISDGGSSLWSIGAIECVGWMTRCLAVLFLYLNNNNNISGSVIERLSGGVLGRALLVVVHRHITALPGFPPGQTPILRAGHPS